MKKILAVLLSVLLLLCAACGKQAEVAEAESESTIAEMIAEEETAEEEQAQEIVEPAAAETEGEEAAGETSAEAETEAEAAPVYTPVVITGTVNIFEVNVRSGPGTDYDILTTYLEGHPVSVTETYDDGEMEWGHAEDGWLLLKYVTITYSAQPAAASETGSPAGETAVQEETTGITDAEPTDCSFTGTVNTYKVNVRSGPGTDYDVVTVVRQYSTVSVTQTQTVNGTIWARVDQGWMMLKYIDRNQ